ncbi:hypothetical protein H5203_21840 [Pseudoalteromonas sp. SG41-1]|uniref:hypothetical protein n=1 Tax=Pseudoalteromonas sp. SG41-1 TaxID=2760979 RepID=UPI001601AB3B|nr:hypothetical protein [Pseudoalteromonas sp. SG41-1]MBB1508081.1 hypothetical protein [Pseudoalteromonas sp. SG41-1]
MKKMELKLNDNGVLIDIDTENLSSIELLNDNVMLINDYEEVEFNIDNLEAIREFDNNHRHEVYFCKELSKLVYMEERKLILKEGDIYDLDFDFYEEVKIIDGRIEFIPTDETRFSYHDVALTEFNLKSILLFSYTDYCEFRCVEIDKNIEKLIRAKENITLF